MMPWLRSIPAKHRIAFISFTYMSALGMTLRFGHDHERAVISLLVVQTVISIILSVTATSPPPRSKFKEGRF